MSRATPRIQRRPNCLTPREEPLRNTVRTRVALVDVRTRASRIWRYRVSTLAMTLVMVWLLGSVSSITMGGFLHILLVVAIGLMLQRVIYGRKVVGY